MKKVLCGLVIALMMTGSGYVRAIEASKENCLAMERQFHGYLGFALEEPRDFDKEMAYVSASLQYLSLWSQLCD